MFERAHVPDLIAESVPDLLLDADAWRCRLAAFRMAAQARPGLWRFDGDFGCGLEAQISDPDYASVARLDVHADGGRLIIVELEGRADTGECHTVREVAVPFAEGLRPVPGHMRWLLGVLDARHPDARRPVFRCVGCESLIHPVTGECGGQGEGLCVDAAYALGPQASTWEEEAWGPPSDDLVGRIRERFKLYNATMHPESR